MGDPRTCTFRVGKTILQRSISREEIAVLLAEGRTPLLDGFISKRTNRPFKAFLVWEPKKKSVGFEFEKREKAEKAAKSEASAAEAPAGAAEEAPKKPARRTTARHKRAESAEG